MPVPINYIAVFGAAVASMALGALWYGPLFGKPWVALMGWTPEEIETAKARGKRSYVLAALGSLIMAYVLAHSLVFASSYLMLDTSYVNGSRTSAAINAGLMVGFWNWLGFIAPVTLGTVLWEGKSRKLWLLNNAYHLLSLLVMGVILALWP